MNDSAVHLEMSNLGARRENGWINEPQYGLRRGEYVLLDPDQILSSISKRDIFKTVRIAALNMCLMTGGQTAKDAIKSRNNTIALVSALIAALAMTSIIVPPACSGLPEQECHLNEDGFKVYGVFMGMGIVGCLLSVLFAVMNLLNVELVAAHEMLFFIHKYLPVLTIIPQGLLAIGIVATCLGITVYIYVIYGYIVIGIVGGFGTVFLLIYVWFGFTQENCVYKMRAACKLKPE